MTSPSVLTIAYACIYGISSVHPHLKPGQQITCFNDDWSILSVVGKNGRTFWFLFLKLEKEYAYGHAPKFSREDAIGHCDRLSAFTFWDTVTFGDVWNRREIFTMTPLEEGVFQQWSCQRIVCIGDSMHKVCLKKAFHDLFSLGTNSGAIVRTQYRARSQLRNGGRCRARQCT